MQSLGPYLGTHLGARISAYVDGALEDSERAAAQAHLADCADCQRRVRRQHHLKQRMHGVGTAAPPASLVAALADRAGVEQHVQRADHRRRVLVHAAVTVGSLCASLTVVGLVAGGSAAPTASRAPGSPVAVSATRAGPSTVPTVVRSIGLGVAYTLDAGRRARSLPVPQSTGVSAFLHPPQALDRRPGR